MNSHQPIDDVMSIALPTMQGTINEHWTPTDLLNAFRQITTTFNLTQFQYDQLPPETRQLFQPIAR